MWNHCPQPTYGDRLEKSGDNELGIGLFSSVHARLVLIYPKEIIILKGRAMKIEWTLSAGLGCKLVN